MKEAYARFKGKQQHHLRIDFPSEQRLPQIPESKALSLGRGKASVK